MPDWESFGDEPDSIQTSVPGVVLVPVPVEHLGAVYRALGSAIGKASTSTPPGLREPGEDVPAEFRRGQPLLVDDEQGYWTQPMVEALLAEMQGSPAIEALKVIAYSSPSPIDYAELVERTGLDRDSLRAAMANMTKATRRLFRRRTWPMTVRQSSNKTYYRMLRPMAEWIVEAL